MAQGRLMILQDSGKWETYRGQAVAIFKIVAESNLECVYATFTSAREAECYMDECVKLAESWGLTIYNKPYRTAKAGQ